MRSASHTTVRTGLVYGGSIADGETFRPWIGNERAQWQKNYTSKETKAFPIKKAIFNQVIFTLLEDSEVSWPDFMKPDVRFRVLVAT